MAPNWKTLDPKAITQLAKILQIPCGESGDAYFRRIEAALPGLPRAIKHRAEILSMYDVVTGRTTLDDYIEPAKLCTLHSGLSQTIIHQVFSLLALEIGHNLNSLVGHAELMTEIQRNSIYNLRELHSLWLPAQDYFKTFAVNHNPKWPFQKSRCEGCILAHIGSDEQAVCELKVVLMSRRRTLKPRPGHPRLLGLIDAWLEGLFPDQHLQREMKQGLSVQGEELKIIRKSIKRKRREQREQHELLDLSRKHRRHTIAAAPRHDSHKRDRMSQRARAPPAPPRPADPPLRVEEPNDDPDSDYENDIIDHYAKLQSSMPVDRAMPPCESYPPLSPYSGDEESADHPPVSPLVSSTEGYVPPRQELAWLSQPYSGANDHSRPRSPRALSTRSSWFTIMYDNAVDVSKDESAEKPLYAERPERRTSKITTHKQRAEPRRRESIRHAPPMNQGAPPNRDSRPDRKGKSKARESVPHQGPLLPLPASANRADRSDPLKGSDSGRRAAQIVQDKYGQRRSAAPVLRPRSNRASIATQRTTWEDFCQ